MKPALAVSLLALLAAPQALADDPPAKIVSGFYAVHQASDQDGVPNAALRAKYAPYVAPALAALLAQADAAEARYDNNNRDYPPLVEGDPFTPNMEGETGFQVGPCAGDAGLVRCPVALTYDESKTSNRHAGPPAKPISWTDTVTLVNAGDGWRIADIAFGGRADPGNPARLTDVLKAAIAEGER